MPALIASRDLAICMVAPNDQSRVCSDVCNTSGNCAESDRPVIRLDDAAGSEAMRASACMTVQEAQCHGTKPYSKLFVQHVIMVAKLIASGAAIGQMFDVVRRAD